MKLINPENEKFKQAVKVDAKDCEIDCNKLDAGEGVVCPHDKDLKIGKSPTGEIILSKKSFTQPFKK